MANIRTETIRIGPWPGGLVRDHSKITMNVQAIPDALNVDFLDDGSIRKRRGYAKFSTADDVNLKFGRYIYYWIPEGEALNIGDPFLIYVDDDDFLWHMNLNDGTTLVKSMFGGGQIKLGHLTKAFTGLGNTLYVTSRGTDLKTFKFDGDVWTEITDNVLDGSGNEFPRASFLLTQHARIFAGNININGTRHHSRIWFSAPGEGDLWPAENFIDINPDDGTSITGMYSFGDRIIVFKDTSFYVLVGTDTSTFTVFQISPHVGATESLAATEVNGKFIWYDGHTDRIWEFDGAEHNPIDTQIHHYFKANRSVPQGGPFPSGGRIWRARGFSRDGKAFLSFGWNSSSTRDPERTLVYDVAATRWTEYDFGFADMVAGLHKVYMVGPRHSGENPGIGVYEFNDPSFLTDDGANINTHFHTMWVGPNADLAVDSRLRKIQVYARGVPVTGSPATLTVATHRDYDSSTAFGTSTFSNQTAFDYAVKEIGGIDHVARAWSVHISNNSANEWAIDAIDFIFSSRERTQGVRE